MARPGPLSPAAQAYRTVTWLAPPVTFTVTRSFAAP
jgi:hypothetical protein